MKELYSEFLEYFDDIPVGEQKLISPFMISHFEKPTVAEAVNFENTNYYNRANAFIGEVKAKNHIKVSDIDIKEIKFDVDQMRYIWYDEVDVMAVKTIDADEYLNKRKLNLSAIEVN